MIGRPIGDGRRRYRTSLLHFYTDTASGKRDDRSGLDACIKALRHDDTLAVWRARGRRGGAFKMTRAKRRLARAAMGKPETMVAEPCAEPGFIRKTLYRHITPKGEIRPDGKKLLKRKS